MPRISARLFLTALFALGLSAPASAAAPPHRAAPAITGVVVDSTGAVLPYARVDLIGSSSPAPASTTTSPTGTFRFGPLRPGRYQVRVSLDGFETTTVAVEVRDRTPATVKITLPLAGVHQEVTVTSQTPQVSTGAASNADAVSVTQHTLESLPVFDDDAVATLSRFLDSGAIGQGGVTILVNGMEVNGLNVSTSAIAQIKINQDPYSAAFSRPGRGRINIITKPGSQAYHGDGSFIFRDAALNATNVFATTKPPEQRKIGDAFLGGPVGRSGRTSFMFSLKDDTEARQAIVYALGPDGPIKGAVPQPYRHLLASVGITHQRGRSTISVRPSFEEERDAYRGVGGTVLGSAGTTYYHSESDLTYEQQTVFSASLLNQFQILVGHEVEPETSVSSAPGIVVDGAFTGGGASTNYRRTETHFQISENLTVMKGRHLLQVGFQVPDWSQRGFNDQSGFNGTFYFANLAAYEAGTPYAYIRQTGNSHVAWLEKVLGFYANDDWQLRPGATLSFGLRYDWSNYFHDHDTLAPRFSLAVKPGGAKSTVIRAGAGLFWDKIGPFPIIDVRELQPGGIQRLVLTNPSYPDPYASASAAQAPPSIVRFAPGIELPWTLQYSAGVEQQLFRTATLSIMYYGSDSRMFRSTDVNAPMAPLYLTRPDPAYGQIRQIDSSARQLGNSLQLMLRGRVTRWFNGQVQYTLSRTMNDSGGLNWFPANDYDLSGEWARANFDRRHRLLLLGTITTARQVDLGVALTIESGLPYSEVLPGDPYNNGRGGARPAGVGRNTLQGAGSAELDLRLSRTFAVGGGTGTARKLTLGVDAFNVLNRVNYLTYVGTVTSPLFGQPVTAQAPRQLQLSMRFSF
ncbi:MAG: TonB-dependent receptor [Acidobacteriota bacterium]|nr:TonB-dependent receptor [Acidobacteriota bacterium]